MNSYGACVWLYLLSVAANHACQAFQMLRRMHLLGPCIQNDVHDKVCASLEDGKLIHHIDKPIYHGDPVGTA